MSKCSKWESEGHSERIKAKIVLNEPCFLNLYRRCIDIGRGSLALFSARARERPTASWSIVEERENQRTKAKPHYKTQLNSKKIVPAAGYAKSKTKNISVQIEIGLPRTSDHLKIWLGIPDYGISRMAPYTPVFLRTKLLRWNPYQT